MAKPNIPFREEVSELVERSVAAEAAAKVWQRFEAALEELDEQSQEIFAEFLNGTSVATLAQQRGLEPSAMQDWIKQIKRQLNEKLRQTAKVKQ